MRLVGSDGRRGGRLTVGESVRFYPINEAVSAPERHQIGSSPARPWKLFAQGIPLHKRTFRTAEKSQEETLGPGG